MHKLSQEKSSYPNRTPTIIWYRKYQCLETDRLFDPVVPLVRLSLALVHDRFSDSDRSRREWRAGAPRRVTTEWSVDCWLCSWSDSADRFILPDRERILYGVEEKGIWVGCCLSWAVMGEVDRGVVFSYTEWRRWHTGPNIDIYFIVNASWCNIQGPSGHSLIDSLVLGNMLLNTYILNIKADRIVLPSTFSHPPVLMLMLDLHTCSPRFLHFLFSYPYYPRLEMTSTLLFPTI